MSNLKSLPPSASASPTHPENSFIPVVQIASASRRESGTVQGANENAVTTMTSASRQSSATATATAPNNTVPSNVTGNASPATEVDDWERFDKKDIDEAKNNADTIAAAQVGKAPAQPQSTWGWLAANILPASWVNPTPPAPAILSPAATVTSPHGQSQAPALKNGSLPSISPSDLNTLAVEGMLLGGESRNITATQPEPITPTHQQNPDSSLTATQSPSANGDVMIDMNGISAAAPLPRAANFCGPDAGGLQSIIEGLPSFSEAYDQALFAGQQFMNGVRAIAEGTQNAAIGTVNATVYAAEQIANAAQAIATGTVSTANTTASAITHTADQIASAAQVVATGTVAAANTTANVVTHTADQFASAAQVVAAGTVAAANTTADVVTHAAQHVGKAGQVVADGTLAVLGGTMGTTMFVLRNVRQGVRIVLSQTDYRLRAYAEAHQRENRRAQFGSH